MFCVHCGNEIPNDSKFCVICGAPVEELQGTDGDETVLLNGEQLSGLGDEYIYTDQGGDWAEYQYNSDRKKGIIIFLISLFGALLIAAGIIFVFKPFSDEPNQGIIRSTVEVDSEDIVIIDSDWDWDSSRGTSGNYSVDVIMSVENTSDTAITGMDFDVFTLNDEPITNEEDPEAYFTAYGYIPANASGIMVAEVVVDNKEIKPSQVRYGIATVNTNPDISEDYAVPEGIFTGNSGPDDDYYDIMVSNPNDVSINSSSKVVAVRFADGGSGEFSDDYPADATGKIMSDIEPYDDYYEQEKAFIDPKLNSKKSDKYTIYVIDIDYYKSEAK